MKTAKKEKTKILLHVPCTPPPPPPECMVSKLKDCRQNICHMTWLAATTLSHRNDKIFSFHSWLILEKL